VLNPEFTLVIVGVSYLLTMVVAVAVLVGFGGYVLRAAFGLGGSGTDRASAVAPTAWTGTGPPRPIAADIKTVDYAYPLSGARRSGLTRDGIAVRVQFCDEFTGITPTTRSSVTLVRAKATCRPGHGRLDAGGGSRPLR
jgi:hypothetical protein